MSGSSILVTLNALRARLTPPVKPLPSLSSPQMDERAAGNFDGGFKGGAGAVNVLVYLVPIALMLGLTGLAVFLWTLKSGQYDDLTALPFASFLTTTSSLSKSAKLTEAKLPSCQIHRLAMRLRHLSHATSVRFDSDQSRAWPAGRLLVAAATNASEARQCSEKNKMTC